MQNTLAAIRGQLDNVFTWLPGQVVSYDGTKNLADVAVMVKMPLVEDGQITTFEDLGTLPEVPVGFYRAGGFYMAGPIAKNDEGILLFSASGLGEWRQSGQKSEPSDVTRHGIGWPLFIPGAFNDTRTLPDTSARASGMVIGKEGSNEQILLQSGLIQAGASGADNLVTKTDFNAFLLKLSTLLTTSTAWLDGGTASGALNTLLATPQPIGCKPNFTTLFKGK